MERDEHFTVFYRKSTVTEAKWILGVCPWVQDGGAVADLSVKPIAKFAVLG